MKRKFVVLLFAFLFLLFIPINAFASNLNTDYVSADKLSLWNNVPSASNYKKDDFTASTKIITDTVNHSNYINIAFVDKRINDEKTSDKIAVTITINNSISSYKIVASKDGIDSENFNDNFNIKTDFSLVNFVRNSKTSYETGNILIGIEYKNTNDKKQNNNIAIDYFNGSYTDNLIKSFNSDFSTLNEKDTSQKEITQKETTTKTIKAKTTTTTVSYNEYVNDPQQENESTKNSVDKNSNNNESNEGQTKFEFSEDNFIEPTTFENTQSNSISEKSHLSNASIIFLVLFAILFTVGSVFIIIGIINFKNKKETVSENPKIVEENQQKDE